MYEHLVSKLLKGFTEPHHAVVKQLRIPNVALVTALSFATSACTTGSAAQSRLLSGQSVNTGTQLARFTSSECNLTNIKETGIGT